MTAADRKARLEAQMTKMIGQPVTITVRGEKSFTFSTDEAAADLGEKVSAFFGKLATVSVDHDDECGSFAYVEAAI